MPTVRAHIDLDVTPEQAWEAAVDWPGQSAWVIGSSVRATSGGGRGVGATIEAVTGIGPLALHDPMQIVEWDPPHRVVLHHVGTLVRGDAVYEVERLPGNRSRLVWAETLQASGPVLRVAYAVGTPLFGVMVRWSLRRFARVAAKRPVLDA
ncbi:MAG TPA: SRPBCC family protein [Acidimicrobiales bacterium]|nr:SRPBCC family protein [Acidimicrobiales bacterium]